MIIIGISAFYHDSAACIVKDGVILAAAQEERFSRNKHDSSFPINSIKYCLDFAKVNIEDVSYVSYYENPSLKFKRLIKTYLAFSPKGIKTFVTSMTVWIIKKLWIWIKPIKRFLQQKTYMKI